MSDTARKVVEIKGTIETADGTTTEFSIFKDFGWSQWGGTTAELGTRVDVLEAMVDGLKDAEGGSFTFASDNDEDDDEDSPHEGDEDSYDYDGAIYRVVRYYGPGDGRPNQVRQTGLTLAQAKAHCSDPASKGNGWFDGFTREG